MNNRISINRTIKVLGLSLILLFTTGHNSNLLQAQGVVNPGDDVYVTVAPTAQLAAETNSETLLDVSSNTTWTASSNESWLTVSPSTATLGSAKLTLKASTSTSADRTAKVVLTAVGVKPQEISVTQKAAPTITSFTPDKAGNGTTVTILGTNFTGTTAVSFGGVDAKSFSLNPSGTRIIAVVGTGASGTIRVTTAGGEVTSTGTLTWASGIVSTPGNLKETISNAGFDGSSLKELTVTGNINATDFRFMRDEMLELEVLDLSGATIVTYSGTNGTAGTSSISYPENEIPQYAFHSPITNKGKECLITLTFPENITSIGVSSFAGCTGLKNELILPSTLLEIRSDAFSGCNKLSGDLNIPINVKTIRNGAFVECTGFSSNLNLPESLLEIGESAFARCSGFTGTLKLPANLKTLVGGAFMGCTGFSALILSPQLTSIEESTFYECTGLSGTLTIPSGIINIKSQSFQNCKKLSSIVFDSNSSLKTIEAYAFAYCTSLTGALILPSSGIEVLGEAFNRCTGLTSVTIPANISKIDEAVFAECSGLTSISSYPTSPVNLNASPDVFLDVNKTTCRLIVPSTSFTAYSTANQWKDFFSIKEPSKTSLSAFSTISGTASASQTFTVGVSATMLDLTVTAPSGYEVRENNTGTFGSSVTFESTTGNIGDKTIEVRLKSSTAVGTPSGDVVCSSTGASSKNVAASGTVTKANEAPTNVALTRTAIDENVAANTVVGTLSSTDADTGNTFTYLLVDGDGSADNAAFNIAGSNLRITANPNFETKNSYSIRIRTTDQGDLWFEKSVTITIKDVNEAPTTGNGEIGTPFEIQTLDHLNWLSQTPSVWGSYFIQTAHIDATSTSTWNSGVGFSPIGNNTDNFTGSYDGKGHTINGLTINRSDIDYVGLFGYSSATISNIGVINVNITGKKYVGGLVGYNSVRLNNSGYNTGAVADPNSESINNTYTSGTVIGHNLVGGLIGMNNHAQVSASYSNVKTEGQNDIGGLIGQCWGEGIYNSYATGKADGWFNVGGLIGYLGGEAAVVNCYALGQTMGSSIGGLIGFKETGTITNSFWDTETSGQAVSAGGTGKTTDEMKAFATFNAAGWDLKGETTNGSAEFWNIGNNRNDGYPYLSWQYPNEAGYKMPTPTITSVTYNGSTAVFELTCTNIASGDVIVPSKFTVKGQGGSTYTLTTTNVTASNATTVSITINATDKAAINKILNKNGTSSIDATSYNLVAADNWNATVVSENMADANSIITVSNLPLPTISEFSPALGIIGSSITITGANFNTTIAENEVYLGTVKATITAATATTLTFTIPNDAVTGKIKVVLDNGQEVQSNSDLIVVISPTFRSSAPASTVGYKELFNYIATVNTGGDETTSITLPTKPTWITQTGDFISKPKAFVNIPLKVDMSGITTDMDGNTYSITNGNDKDNDPLTIYKTTPDGTTTVWKENLPTGFVLQLHISDGYIYIPRLGDEINSITRIPLANPAANEEHFATLKFGAAGLAEKDGYIYASDYLTREIVKINKLTGDTTIILNSSDGIPEDGPLGLSFDTSGNLLISTYENKSILKYNGTELTTLISDLPYNVLYINVDKQNDIYVVLEDHGLRRYKPDFSSYELISENEDDEVWGVHIAESGAVFYSTMSNVIYKLNPSVTLQGTPGKSNIGPHNVVIRATNSAGYTEQAFTINVVDNVSPVISAFRPATLATGVALKPTLDITFDEEVSLGTSGILGIYDGTTIVKSYDLSVVADRALFSLSTDKKTISITLTENLSANTEYGIGLGAGFVKDSYDNDFAGFKVGANLWQFTTINKVAQTITFPEITAKTYGAAAFSLGDATTDKGLTVTYTATDESVVSIVGNQATILKAGETKITATQNGDNSTFAASPVEGILKVNKAPLTITAENKSKIYDGQAHTDFTVTYTGFVKDETAAALAGTLAFEGTATTATNVGNDYVVTPKGFTSNNYIISFDNGKLEITKRPITLTADPKSKVYGDADPTFTAQVTSGTIVTGDAASGTLKRAAGENVNEYAISKDSYTFGSNYNETFVSDNLTITKRPLSVTAIATSKNYDCSTTCLGAPIVGALASGDAVSKEPTQVYDNLHAGSNHVLIASGLSIKDNTNTDVTNNYNISYLPSPATGLIRAKQLSISEPIVNTNKVFDGSTTAIITTIGKLEGVEMADITSVGVSAIATYNNNTVGINKVITVTYTLTGSVANNYIAPANYVIYGAKIAGDITLSPLTDPMAGCDGALLNLDYRILSGTPTKYKISFNNAAIAAGMLAVSTTNLAPEALNGTIGINIPIGTKAGSYQGTLVLSDDLGIESAGYTFNFSINLSASLIRYKFKNVIFFDDNINRATSFQWYKNGVEIPGATKQFYMDPAGLIGTYSVKIINTEGKTLSSCEKTYDIPLTKKVQTYPNPVKIGQACRIDVLGFANNELENTQLSVYNAQGVRVYQSGAVEINNSIYLPAMEGVYVGQFTTANGETHVFKIVVAD